MIIRVRRLILHLLAPFTARLAVALARKEVFDADDYAELMSAMPGDVLAVRTRWNFSNLFIPGRYKHVMMSMGEGLFVEATYPVVRYVRLFDVLNRVSDATLVAPRFLSDEERELAARKMSELVGKPYDLLFEPNHRSFYCSEAVLYSYRKAAKEWHLSSRKIMGIKTDTPQDIVDSEYFRTVWSMEGR